MSDVNPDDLTRRISVEIPLTPDEALTQLRAISQLTDRVVTDVATDIVEQDTIPTTMAGLATQPACPRIGAPSLREGHGAPLTGDDVIRRILLCSTAGMAGGARFGQSDPGRPRSPAAPMT